MSAVERDYFDDKGNRIGTSRDDGLTGETVYYDRSGNRTGTSRDGGWPSVSGPSIASLVSPGWWVPFRILYWLLPPVLVAVILASVAAQSWDRFRLWSTVSIVVAIILIVPCMLILSRRAKWDIRSSDYVMATFFALPWLGALVFMYSGNWMPFVLGLALGFGALVMPSRRRR